MYVGVITKKKTRTRRALLFELNQLKNDFIILKPHILQFHLWVIQKLNFVVSISHGIFSCADDKIYSGNIIVQTLRIVNI
jgi:hypothetical protein